MRNGYDAVGNLVTIDGVFDDELDPRRLWTFLDDDDGLRIRLEQLGHAITTTRTYQPRSSRLQSLHSEAGGTVLQNLTYGYDAAGRVRSTIDAVEPASSRIYRHDALDRLEKVFQAVDNDPQRIGALVRQLSYDPTGNILTQTGIGDYRYDIDRPHAVLSAGDNVYEYDDNGNQILRTGPDVAGGQQRIEYTPFDLPKRVYVATDPTPTRFGYDAQQRRVVKAGPNGTTIYVDNLYERTTTTPFRRERYSCVIRQTGCLERWGAEISRMIPCRLFHDDDCLKRERIQPTSAAMRGVSSQIAGCKPANAAVRTAQKRVGFANAAPNRARIERSGLPHHAIRSRKWFAEWRFRPLLPF